MHGDVTIGTVTRRAATSAQIHAVYTAMRILAEDDRERGAALDTFVCAACRRHRSTAGAIRYAATHLCNGCATDFEVLRMAGLVVDVDDYLAEGSARLQPDDVAAVGDDRLARDPVHPGDQ